MQKSKLPFILPFYAVQLEYDKKMHLDLHN